VVDDVSALIQTPRGWRRFRNPVRIVRTDDQRAVVGTLDQVEQLVRETGLTAVGFLTYEAGGGFGLPVRESTSLPLVWFGLFDDEREADLPGILGGYRLDALTPTLDRAAFGRAYTQIKRHLAEGDTYQVNFTFKMRASFNGDPEALFADLALAQQGRHAAFVNIGSHAICSASPELFVERSRTHLEARPMKGTIRRGRTLAEDGRQQILLQTSPKQRAENVMIVDMIRNDLGRIARVGSVAVPELFQLERYPNVWQMTSLVTAESAAPLAAVVGALHPSASVTGAPKLSTMRIIAALEAEPRGIYTGAIGYVSPEGSMRFNVAIRTAVVDSRARTLEFGIGSGIVWDSDVASEYDECLLKGSILGLSPPRFDLLETLRWDPCGKYFLADRHLSRMRDSAEYFGYPFDRRKAEAALAQSVAGTIDDVQRVRLLLSSDGEFRTERRRHEPFTRPVSVRLAAAPVDDSDPFLFHKTTNRGVYEQRLAILPTGVDDVVLWNSRSEVTESTTANIVIKSGDVLRTPPVESGLLAGTFRADLLDRKEISEAVVSIDDLRRADRIWLINSVHEWREARLI
jgi:para-aminobenzoate synthetase/4-amino-4-deoxychorismate lyase